MGHTGSGLRRASADGPDNLKRMGLGSSGANATSTAGSATSRGDGETVPPQVASWARTAS